MENAFDLVRSAETPKELPQEERVKLYKALIETRGEGGYFATTFCTQYMHPTGRLYTLAQGSMLDLPTLTPEERGFLITLAESFDQRTPQERQKFAPKPASGSAKGDRPGDHFNAQADWESILEPHGWTIHSVSGETTYWTRPGKPEGVSASTNHDNHDLLWLWTSSCPELDSEYGYSKFYAYAALNHDGDVKAATKALAGKGYGKPKDTWNRKLAENPIEPDREPGPVPPDAESRLLIDWASNIDPVAYEWIWPGRIGIGKTNLLGGEGGVGKGCLAMDIIARITTGTPFPYTDNSVKGKVLILSAEDNSGDTLIPRLIAAKADRTHVAIVRGIKTAKGDSPTITLSTDLAEVARFLETHGDIRLVFIDPIACYAGGIKEETTAIRTFLAPIEALAQKYRVAVLMVRHFRKATGGSAKDKFSGANDWLNAARSALGVYPDQEDASLKHVYSTKGNYSKKWRSMSYRTVDSGYRPPGAIEDIVCIQWGEETDYSPDDSTPVSGRADKAVEFLQDMLSGGEVKGDVLFAEAKREGISRDAIFQAKKEHKINIHVRQAGFGSNKAYWWSLKQ